MAEVTEDKLVKLFKANSELKQTEAAQKLGVSTGAIPMTLFCVASVKAGVYSKAPATAVSVKKLRSEGNRWELIAARTGLSVTKVKELFGGEEAARASYSGRGRNYNESAAPRTTVRATATKPAAKKPAAKKPAAKRTGAKKPAARTIVRNRAGRRSSASNPS